MNSSVDPASWFETKTLAPGLTRFIEPFVHKFFRANIFHVVGRDADLVVDSGMGLVPLRPVLAIPKDKPVIALATHAHADHAGGLREFEERLGHAAEEDGFATMDDAFTLAHLFRDLPDALTAVPPTGKTAASYAIPPAPLTRLVDEGDTVDLGDRVFDVLHLPGHSPGSIGLLDQKTGELFAGDAIYAGTLVDDVPGSDRTVYRRTMARLAKLDVRLVHGGHNDTIDGKTMQAIARLYLETTADLA